MICGHGRAALFTRDKLLIAVVGDIDADDPGQASRRDVRRPARDGIGKPTSPRQAWSKGPLVEVVERDIPQSIIQFGHAGITRDDPDFIAAYVMNDILGGRRIRLAAHR